MAQIEIKFMNGNSIDEVIARLNAAGEIGWSVAATKQQGNSLLIELHRPLQLLVDEPLIEGEEKFGTRPKFPNG